LKPNLQSVFIRATSRITNDGSGQGRLQQPLPWMISSFKITGDATQDRLCHDDPSRPDDVYKHPDADNRYLIITN
jgi:hypothetical protein